MKRTLKLTLNEIKHLKWTVLVTALALTLFTAALFSVLFVYNDLAYNVFNYFDETGNPLTFFAYGASVNQITDTSNDGLYVGTIDSITSSGLTITADNGNTFETEYDVVENLGGGVNIVHSYSLSGYAVVVTEKYLEYYSEIMREVPLPTKVGEVLLDVEISEGLQVTVGDKVNIGGQQFTVCGTFDRDEYNWEKLDISSHWILSVDENTVFERLHVEREKSQQVYEMFLKSQRAGIEVSYGGWLTDTYMDNMALVEGFLIAVAAVIFVVNLLILYATFSLILNNRRAYVCRLKVIGASDVLVFATYFIIIAVLLVVICVAAFFLSQAIVSSIMDACGEAFGAAFTTRVSFGLVGVYFAVITVLLGLLCYASVKKIDNKAIVTATRSD